MTRNKLTHGAKSFSEYGKSVRLNDIKKKKESVYNFLLHLINITQNYLQKKQYLKNQ